MNEKPQVEVFWISGSPYSWRVLLALAVKQVPFKSHLLSVSDGELTSQEFLDLNPRGKVPTLRHGDLTMGESIAIIRYIDRCFPQPPLFGNDGAEEAKINQQIDEIENYILPNSHSITRAVFGDIVADKEELLNTQAGLINSELTGIDNRIDTWLIGKSITAADIVLYPLVAGLLRAANKPAAKDLDLQFLPFDEKYPRLAEWCKSLGALPGFNATYPPHWRNS